MADLSRGAFPHLVARWRVPMQFLPPSGKPCISRRSPAAAGDSSPRLCDAAEGRIPRRGIPIAGRQVGLPSVSAFTYFRRRRSRRAHQEPRQQDSVDGAARLTSEAWLKGQGERGRPGGVWRSSPVCRNEELAMTGPPAGNAKTPLLPLHTGCLAGGVSLIPPDIPPALQG